MGVTNLTLGHPTMSISMYTLSVGVFTRMLTNLQGVLAKAETYAAERKFSPDTYLSMRLAPDMRPFSFQIQSATDRAKLFTARVAGQDAPSWPDDEASWEQIKARLQKGIDYLAAFKPEQLDGSEQKLITLPTRGGDVQVSAEDYLLKNALPNFYFHVTTAYDLLRHAGVPIGKRDFTGV